jgi:hypothetical protein
MNGTGIKKLLSGNLLLWMPVLSYMVYILSFSVYKVLVFVGNIVNGAVPA